MDLIVSNPKHNRMVGLLQKQFTQENILLLVYIIITCWMLSLHAVWRDEGQAWLLTRDQPSLIDIVANINYEGTPALWHVCLYILNHILQLPLISMRLLHSALNFAAVYLFVKKTDFSFIIKILFCGAYLIVYEYNIVARSYVLTLLLLLIWALLYSQRFLKPKCYALVIALLAQANSFGFLISVVLGGNYLFEILLSTVQSRRQLVLFKNIGDKITSGLLIVVGLVLSYLQMRQTVDSAFIFSEVGGTSIDNLVHAVFGGFTSIQPAFLYMLNSQPLHNPLYYHSLELYCALSILSASIVLMFKERRIGLMYLETLLIIMGFYVYAFHLNGFRGYLRHWGIFFIVFICCSVVVNSELLKQKKSTIALELFIMLLLLVQVFRGIEIITDVSTRMFSSGKAAAQYLLQHNLVKERNVAIYPSNMAPSILAYLPKNVRFYFPETNVWGSYALWSRGWRQNRNIGYQGMLAKVEADKNLDRQVDYFITNEKITIPWYQSKVKLLKSWSGSFVLDENFYIYHRER